MKKAALLTLLALVALVATTGCEPKMTITAKPIDTRPGCGQIASVYGTVKPAKATTKVVIQRTVGGKWVDWKWVTGDTGDTTPHLLSAVPRSDGGFEIGFQVPFDPSPIHMRVRSAGGTASPAFYMTPTEYDSGQCA